MSSQDNIRKEVSKLRFNIDRSCRYHARRRSFFDLWHRVIMFLVILLGSAAFSDALSIIGRGGGDSAKVLAFIAALLAALDLVVGFSHRARDHALLYMRFMDLAVEIANAVEPSVQELSRWNAKRYTIEKDEPPEYRALNFACYNEAVVARGSSPEACVPLSWWQKLWMHFWRFSGMDGRSVRERRNSAPNRAQT